MGGSKQGQQPPCGGTAPLKRDRAKAAHGKYHTDQSRAHAYIYIKVPYFTSFRFPFIDCRVRVRVSSRVRDSVSFIFIAFFPFRCMLKNRKLQPGQYCLRGLMVRCSYCAY